MDNGADETRRDAYLADCRKLAQRIVWWYDAFIFVSMSGMLDLSRDEKAKHFLPR